MKSASAAPLVQIFWPLTMKTSPSRRAEVRTADTSEPASGSLMPIAHMEVPAMIPGRWARRCSSVPYWRSEGPIWRSAIQELAIGAPSEISASTTAKRSSAVLPPPPASFGQVMPSQPRSPISRENSGELPTIQASSLTGRDAAASRATAAASSWRRCTSAGIRKSTAGGLARSASEGQR